MVLSCGKLTLNPSTVINDFVALNFKDKIVPDDVVLAPDTIGASSYLTIYRIQDNEYRLVQAYKASETRTLKTKCTLPPRDIVISVYSKAALSPGDTWYTNPTSELRKAVLFDWRGLADMPEFTVKFVVDGVTYTATSSGSYAYISGGVSRFGFLVTGAEGWEQISIICNGGTPKWQASDTDWSLHDIDMIAFTDGYAMFPTSIMQWIVTAPTTMPKLATPENLEIEQ